MRLLQVMFISRLAQAVEVVCSVFDRVDGMWTSSFVDQVCNLFLLLVLVISFVYRGLCTWWSSLFAVFLCQSEQPVSNTKTEP